MFAPDKSNVMVKDNLKLRALHNNNNHIKSFIEIDNFI